MSTKVKKNQAVITSPMSNKGQTDTPKMQILPSTAANLKKYRRIINVCTCGHLERDHENGTGKCQANFECTCQRFQKFRSIDMSKNVSSVSQPTEWKYSFYQEMLVRIQGPTPSGISVYEQLRNGTLNKLTITFEKGLFVMRAS